MATSAEIKALRDANEAETARLMNEMQVFIDQVENIAINTNFDLDPEGQNAYSMGAVTEEMKAELLANKPEKASDIDLVVPAAPGDAPGDFDIRDGAIIPIPDFTISAPNILFPTVPVLVTPDAPLEPLLDAVSVPVAPTVVLPAVPVLPNVEYPGAPGLSLPNFSETFPKTPDLLVLTDDFEYQEELYDNEVLDLITQALIADFDGGNYGVTPEEEESLYERQKDRAFKAASRRESSVVDIFAGRGHPLPPGAIVALLDAEKDSTMEAIAEANRDVSTNRAELLRRGREFTMTSGLSYNQMLITDFGFRRERALNAAKFGAEFGITILNSQINRYNALVSGFQTFAQSYTSQVQAELAKVEIYRAELQGAIAKQEANQTEVDIYKAQIDASNSITNIYESQMRGASLQVEIEQNKVSTFAELTRAYVARIEANKATLDVYSTQIEGEQLKTNVYKSQVDAYETEVQAANIKSNIEIKNIESDIEKARLDIQGYAAEIEGYKSTLSAEVARVTSLTAQYTADTSTYSTIMQSWEAISSLDIKTLDLFFQQLQESTKLDQEATKIALAELKAETEIRLQASDIGAKVYEGVVAAIQVSSSDLAIADDE